MDDISELQHYHTKVNDKPAIFSTNVTDIELFHNKGYNKILQVDFSYEGDENGLPEDEMEVFAKEAKLISHLTTFHEAFFAGYFFSNNQAKTYFYCKNEQELLEELSEFKFAFETFIQDDPKWDIYFDFLLASPLEMKLNAAHEILLMLQEKGRDLSSIFTVEHTFNFPVEADMFQFMDALTEKNYSFNTLKYSAHPIQGDLPDESFYLVKVEQEMALDDGEILVLIENFEYLASQYSGEYIGWECDNIVMEKGQLN